MPLLPAKIKEIEYDLKQFPNPTPLDIRKAEVASLTCKSMKEFAEFLQLDVLTIKIWCRKSKAYFEAVNSWEQQATFEIKKTLAKRALGFTKTTKKDILTRTGTIETLETETYYPPDTAAIQYWLKNRDAVNWKDKTEVDVNVFADIRSWLVKAGGESDLLNVTNIEGETPLIEGEIINNETDQVLETEIISPLEPDDQPPSSLASLNAKWT